MTKAKKIDVKPYSKYCNTLALGKALRKELTGKKFRERAEYALKEAKFRFRKHSEKQWQRSLKVLEWMREFAKADKKMLETKSTKGVAYPQGHQDMSEDEQEPEGDQSITIHRDDIPLCFFLLSEQNLAGRQNEADRLKQVTKTRQIKRKREQLKREAKAINDPISVTTPVPSGTSDSDSDSDSDASERSDSEKSRYGTSSPCTESSSDEEDTAKNGAEAPSRELYDPERERAKPEALENNNDNTMDIDVPAYTPTGSGAPGPSTQAEIEGAQALVTMQGQTFYLGSTETTDTDEVLRAETSAHLLEISNIDTNETIILQTDQELLPGITYDLLYEEPTRNEPDTE